jgi:hypothetical protein
LPPSEEITIDRATTDTGERRTFFGRTARHLITHEHTSRSNEETVLDGWYVDSEALPSDKLGTAFAILDVHPAGQAYGPPVFKVNQTGPKTTGLAVLLKRTGAHEETTSEVTELIQGWLPDDLFQPPPDLDRLSGFSGHWRAAWERLEVWVGSLFP